MYVYNMCVGVSVCQPTCGSVVRGKLIDPEGLQSSSSSPPQPQRERHNYLTQDPRATTYYDTYMHDMRRKATEQCLIRR